MLEVSSHAARTVGRANGRLTTRNETSSEKIGHLTTRFVRVVEFRSVFSSWAMADLAKIIFELFFLVPGMERARVKEEVDYN